MTELRIHLFGGFFLEREGAALPPIASRAGRSLFAYLVMNRDRPLQRDMVAGSFWPELPESRARRRLSQALWQVQDVVNTSSVSYTTTTPDTLAFDASTPYWLDVEEFDHAFEVGTGPDPPLPTSGLDTATLRSCVDLYRGDFMAGYFDDWSLVEQDHYRQRYVTALRQLVDATKAEGAYEEALAHARRLTHHDPLTEGVHQEVMRLCFLLGRTNEAMEQFERLQSVLTEELGSQPSEATIALHEKIVRQRNAGIRPTRAEAQPLSHALRTDSAFVGREGERRNLVDHMESVLAGPGGIVLIEGEPGVGKTRLAAEAADDAEWRGFEVTWGRCSQGALRPFGPLAEVLESLSDVRIEQLTEQVAPVWLAESLRISTRLGQGPGEAIASTPLLPHEESTRMKEALIHTLGALGEITPHLIIIDDVQWADSDTLGVLAQLGSRLRDHRTLLILIYRSEEARSEPEIWDVLRNLDRVAGLGRVVLSPLSVFELNDMVRRILNVASLEPAVSARLHRRTGGNALFTIETLLAWRDQGLLGSGDPAEELIAQLRDDPLPVVPRVRSVIDARISLLSREVAQVYAVAAVCGDGADLSLLAACTDLSRSVVAGGVDELLHRGLLRTDGGGNYTIAHDQVRQVVYEQIPEEDRIALHRNVASALLEARPWDVEAIGHHYREGRDAERAVPHLFEAGKRAAALNAYETASRYLDSAWTLAVEAGWSAEEKWDVLAELESVLGVLGRRDQQQSVLDEMAQLGGEDAVTEGDVARRRTLLLAHAADFTAAAESGQRAVEIARRRSDSPGLAKALIALGLTLRWSGHPLDAIPYLEEATETAPPDTPDRAEALTELASTLVEVQRSDDAFVHLDEARRIHTQLADQRGLAEAAGIEGRALHQKGKRDEAARRFEEAIELCRQIGYRHGEGVNLVNLSVLHHMLGRIADALPGYDRASQVFGDLGNSRGEAMVLANAASARHSLLGDDDRALVDAQKAQRLFRDIGDQARAAQCLETIAGVTARRGDAATAERMLNESLDVLEESGNQFLQSQHLRSLALLFMAESKLEDATATLDRADELCAQAGFSDLATEFDSIRALVALAEGHETEAFNLTSSVVAKLTQGVERRHLVYYRHAVAARAVGELQEAREAATRAHSELESSLAGLTVETIQQAFTNVPEHADILSLVASLTPTTVSMRLPASDAPMGRPLQEDELRTVRWTIAHPDDAQSDDPIATRRQRVLRLLAEAEARGASASIAHLATALEVSDSTIRRDLLALRESGCEVATRGSRCEAS